MSDTVFYQRKNKANQRKVTLGPPAMLIGKAPTKTKRLKMKITMGLNTQKQVGTPEWIAAAHEFVAKNHDSVTPQVEFKGFDINFSTENLFHPDGISASKCQLRSFLVTEVGDAEAPDVVLTFLVYMPFSTTMWEWLGQMSGDEVWARFEQIEQVEDDEDDEQLELTAEDDEDDEEEEEELEDGAESDEE